VKEAESSEESADSKKYLRSGKLKKKWQTECNLCKDKGAESSEESADK
jgi:hypothetical protein